MRMVEYSNNNLVVLVQVLLYGSTVVDDAVLFGILVGLQPTKE